MKEKPLDLAQVPCWRCITTQHLNLKNKLIIAGLTNKNGAQLPAEYYHGSAIFGSTWDNTPQQVKFINALIEIESDNKSSLSKLVYKPEAKPIVKPHERTIIFPKIDTVNMNIDNNAILGNKKRKEKNDVPLMIIEDDNISNTENTTSYVDTSSKLAVIDSQLSKLNSNELNQLQTKLNSLKRSHTYITDDDNNNSYKDEARSEESDNEGGSVIQPLKKSKKGSSDKNGIKKIKKKHSS